LDIMSNETVRVVGRHTNDDFVRNSDEGTPWWGWDESGLSRGESGRLIY